MVLDLVWQRRKRLFPLQYDAYAAAVLANAHTWTPPALAQCLSGTFFRCVNQGLEPDVWRAVATDRLMRLSEIEPVATRGGEQAVWPGLALTRDPRPSVRADLVRQIGAANWGPTLRRLASDGGGSWFDGERAHPPRGRR
jgi:hypothetical protein